jgi:hypothetical protein
MDKRSEPRFQIQSAIRIAAMDQPEDVSNALLLDVSGAGMKIIADGWWPVDTYVVVEMENHVVVARVRNVTPRGPKFSLGAEKVYSVLKHMLPADAPRATWHKLLANEMGEPQLSSLQEEAAAHPATREHSPEPERPAAIQTAPREEPAPPKQASDDIPAEPQVLSSANEAIPPASIVASEPVLAPPPATPVADRPIEQAPAILHGEVPHAEENTISLPETESSLQPDLSREPRRESALVRSNDAAPVKISAPIQPSRSSSTPDSPPLAPAFITGPGLARSGKTLVTPPFAPQFGPAYGMAPTADVLTPVSTMPEPAAVMETKPRWVVSSTVAAGLLGLIALAFYYGPFRPHASSALGPSAANSKTAPLTIPPVTESTSATPSQTAAPAAAIPAAPAKPPAAQSASIAPQTQPVPAKPVAALPAPTSPQGNRRATLKASATNWISACSDGKPAYAKLLNAGDSIDLSFQRTAVFRVGNAAAAEISVDGNPLGPLGPAGTVKILAIDANGVRNLPPNTSPEAECQQASAKP